jgi:putative tricarboxylic transport membrane protein
MDMFSGIIGGFQQCLHPVVLFYCFMGVLIGTLVGVLPGIGPIGAMSMLLPATFGMSPVVSVIVLAGIYYGSQYGGSTTSILVNIPGEGSSVITCLDGYQMARRGRAGVALGISTLGSFIGGTVSVIALQFLVFPLANAALKFGPPEFFALMFLGLTLLTYMTRGSVIDGFLMVIIGLLIGIVGMDPITGKERFVFGVTTFLDGIGLVPVAMGMFGIAEVLSGLETTITRSILMEKIKNLLPNKEDWKRSAMPIARGSLIGFIAGVIPGAGPVMSSFVSYATEKKFAKHPEEFGKGAIEGVAGPETANNAAVGGSFVPLLALGIPPSASMGLLVGALMIHGVTPGPMLIIQHPDIFWGVIASMYIGNVMLVILNLPLIGMWVQVLKIPAKTLLPIILLCCMIGAYANKANNVEVITMIIFGVVGYILRKFRYELAPLVMALVLGPLLEANFRNSLTLADGSFGIFFTRPISAVIITIALLLLASTGLSFYRKTKTRVEAETGEEED